MYISDEEIEFDEDGTQMDDENTPIQSSSQKVCKIEQKEIQFMDILSRVGGVLLSKSLAPDMKSKKKKAAAKMAELVLLETGENMTPAQITKKVCLLRFFSFD